MIGLGTLAKIAKGGLGIDELSELLSQVTGGEMEILPVEGISATTMAVEQLGPFTGETKAALLIGTTRNGERLRGIFTLSPAEKKPSLPS